MTTTNKTRIIVIALVIAVLAVFAYAIYSNTTRDTVVSPHEATNARADAIENYVRANLATLSPVQPTLGGNFYVTRIRLLNGEGTVHYEDGHMAYIADFTYTISEDNRQIEVSGFTLQEGAQ